jgi:Fe-S cluster assembly protein SufD
MTAVLDDKDVYLSSFAEFDRTHSTTSLRQRLQQAARERFAVLGFPTLDDEEWRFTPLSSLTRIPFKLADRPRPLPDRDAVGRLTPDAGDCHRLVCVDGHFIPELSVIGDVPSGVVLGGLASHTEALLAQHAEFEQQPFVALNTAFLHEGVVVLVPRGQILEKPVQLLFLSTVREEPTVNHPRTLVIVGENAQVRLVETYVSLVEGVHFTNAVTEVVAEAGAIVDHYKLLRESTQAFHIATTQILLQRGSQFASRNITLGGGLVRNDINAVLADEHCECTLDGLYVGHGQQLIDNHTRIDHAKPNCASHELYKGILNGKSRGVFNGKIYVHPDAQKTDAKQTNQVLLLSPDAVIDTKPQLEIFADDVKCTHGATVGQLREEALFYLRSRGIGADAARSLLTFAFANDIVGRIKLPGLRAQLEDVLLTAQHLPKYQEVSS